MERKQVRIVIESIRHDLEEDAEKHIYTGSYGYQAGRHFISYKENPAQDDARAVVKNMIKISDSELSISKSGALRTNIVFRQEENHQGVYQTPFGDFSMLLHTKNFDVVSLEEKISIVVNYDLHLNGAFVSNCTVKIEAEFLDG